MTVIELLNLLLEIDPADHNCVVVMPIRTDLPGVFAFEGVCPAVTEMITIGPVPEYMEQDSRPGDPQQEFRALLIAPHSLHEPNEHGDTNVNQTLN